jgi:peptide/nickel transport system ATP-binding protein
MRAPSPTARPLLEAETLEKRYTVRRGFLGGRRSDLPALRGVSFTVGEGETLGLVGESGSGKTTAGRIVARLIEPDAGAVRFDGMDWLALEGSELRRKRRELQVVFQDPQTSLNPRMRVGDQIGEPLRIHRLASGAALSSRVRELLAAVGLPADLATRFPSELSGGQRQRVAIARALAAGPRLVVCDEPVSALDVSIAAQIVNLLLELRERSGLAYLFIAHDIAVVSRIADRIAVFYLGRIVEEGPAAAIIEKPLHPYTAALIAAVPDPAPDSLEPPRALGGEPPWAGQAPSGCPFHPRCPIARDRCRQERPELSDAGGARRVACFFPGELP